jgi:hypothetical protein
MRRLCVLLVVGLALAAAGAAGASTQLQGFRAAKGNVSCVLLSTSGGNLLCTIAHASYAKTLQNRCMNPNGETGAGVDWHGFLFTQKTKARLNCSGGSLYNPSRVRYLTIRYGQTWGLGGFVCTSHVNGLTCRNTRGHGLFISSRSWRTW